MYFILNFLLTTYSSISYTEITTTLSSRNLSLSSTFIALIVILYFVFISYSNYSVSIFYSNIVFTDSQHNISIFIVLFLLFIYMYNLNHWITNFKNFKVGTRINLEFDVIGKYVSRLYAINQL